MFFSYITECLIANPITVCSCFCFLIFSTCGEETIFFHYCTKMTYSNVRCHLNSKCPMCLYAHPSYNLAWHFRCLWNNGILTGIWNSVYCCIACIYNDVLLHSQNEYEKCILNLNISTLRSNAHGAKVCHFAFIFGLLARLDYQPGKASICPRDSHLQGPVTLC